MSGGRARDLITVLALGLDHPVSGKLRVEGIGDRVGRGLWEEGGKFGGSQGGLGST